MQTPNVVELPRSTREAYPLKSAGCDPRVPYALLEQARTDARALYPDSGRIKALWTPNSPSCEIHVEVWDATNRRADVFSADALAVSL